MSQQNLTAVEYLVSIVQKCIAPNYIPIEIVQQAKEIEKTRTDKAYYDGVNDARNNTLRYKYFEHQNK